MVTTAKDTAGVQATSDRTSGAVGGAGGEVAAQRPSDGAGHGERGSATGRKGSGGALVGSGRAGGGGGGGGGAGAVGVGRRRQCTTLQWAVLCRPRPRVRS
eukprot:SAG31_NODE_9130_length_1329_cov_0.921951_2_plen_101_part_00